MPGACEIAMPVMAAILVVRVSPFDPLVLALAAFAVLLLALATSLLPAQRAASTDPMKALRAD